MAERRGTTVVIRLTAELAVIVVGVLIAFGVEAWWSGIQDRRLEREVLESLSTDLATVVDQVAGLIRRDSSIVSRADGFAVADADVTADSVYSLISGLFATVPVEPRLRTYDELVSSGQFHLLSNRELRLLLADFDASALGPPRPRPDACGVRSMESV